MKAIRIVCALLCASLNLISQNQKTISGVPPVRTCGSQAPDPAWDAWFNKEVERFVQKQQAERTNNPNSTQITSYMIPMVVHVLHKTSEGVGTGSNISQAQVNSQLTVLNQDYSATGVNISSCPATFTSTISNTGVQFCLAKIDKNGATMAEPGIDRVDWQAKGWTDPSSFTSATTVQNYFDGTIKPASIWDPSKYLNIWVADMSGSGLLGYATFPAGTTLTGLSGVETASTSGVVILTTGFGNTGNVAAPYNLGRTVTHEVGHWLGLRHIWGDGTCLTDYCNDTPPAQQANFGCPTFPHNTGVCSGNTTGEMTMNFMDYSDDACMYMFTANQATRIQTAMQTGTYRSQLANSTVCNLSTGVAPTAAFSSTPTSVCVGQSITLTDNSTNTPTSWSWTLTGASPSSSTSQNPAITYSASGTYSVTLVATNATGSSAPLTKTITVNALPATTASSATVCSGQQAVITGSGATTYSWSTGASTASASVTPTTTTVYTVTGTNTAGCSKTATSTVTVNALPTVTATSASVCAGQQAVITGSGATTYSWNTGATTASASVTPTATTVYTVTGTNAAGCSRSVTTTVTVKASPTVTVNSPAICSGQSTSITASGASTYTWNTGSSATTITVTPSTTTSYTVTGTGTNGCTKAAVSTVSVTATPGTSVTSSTVCAGQQAIITANGATTYSWNTGATSSSLSVTPTSTTIYTVTGSNGSCSKSSTATVTVNALPVVSVSSATTCAGQQISIIAAGATTYSWNTGATSSTISVTPTSTTIYTVTGTNAGGCSKTATGTVTVNPLPNVTVTSATVCAGQSATISASGATSYTWNTGSHASSLTITPTANTVYTVTGSNSSGCQSTQTASVTVTSPPTVTASSATVCAGQQAVISASGATTYSWNTGATGTSLTVTPTANTTYTVIGTNGSCSNNATANVVVNNLPNVTATSATVCAGQSATITASGASTYSWSTGASSASINFTPTANTTYTVSGTNSNGCSKSITTNVVVNPLPAITASSATVCAGQQAVITASGATSYSWSTGSSSSSITVTPTANTTYTVAGTNGNCTGNTTANVIVNTLPIITASSDTMCAGQQAVLTASGASSYTWNTSATGATLSVTPTASTSYTVTGSNANGCSNSATTNVTVNAVPATPTVTANGLVLSSSSATGNQWYLNGVAITGATGQTYTATQNGNYYVIVTNTSGCDATSNTSTVNSMGISVNNSSVQFSIFPNPASGFVTMVTNGDHELITVEVISSIGQIVFQEKIEQCGADCKRLFDLSGLANGVYLFKVKVNGGYINKQLLIQN